MRPLAQRLRSQRQHLLGPLGVVGEQQPAELRADLPELAQRTRRIEPNPSIARIDLVCVIGAHIDGIYWYAAHMPRILATVNQVWSERADRAFVQALDGSQ